MAEKEKNAGAAIANSNINLTEMRGGRAVHKQVPANLNELNERCKEEWAKVPPQPCERLMKS